MDRMSGAGAFARDADTLISLTKHEMPDAYVVDVTVRNHMPVDSFCVRVEHPIMVRWEAGDPAKLKKINGPEPKYLLSDLMKALGAEKLIRADLQRKYCEKTGASEGTFDKLFRQARDSKDIVKCEDGKKWEAVNPMNEVGFLNLPPRRKEKNSAEVQG